MLERTELGARAWWLLLEPYHAIVYFAPEKKAAYDAAGLKGGWMGYFASRAAAMGPVPAEMVIATFYNFAPAMVRRAIPDAWTFSTPERVLEARLQAVDQALRRMLGDAIESAEVERAAVLAREVAERCDPGGRALFAAHASLPWPAEPHLALWHATTLLREFRGDGHVISLVANGIGPCEANAMQAAAGKFDPSTQREFRGWTDEEWAATVARLAERGLLEPDGSMRAQGRTTLDAVERMTDDLAAPPFEATPADEAEELAAIMRTLVDRIAASHQIPYPNPMGLPAS